MREGWEIRKLGDLADFQRGLTYSKGDEVPFSSKRVLRSNNIDLESSKLDLTELKYLRDDFAIPDDRKVKKNSIFICMSNGSKQHVGKVAFIDTDIDYAFGGFMGLIVPKAGIAPKYVFYSCQSSAYRLFLSSIGNGIGITNLRFTDLANYSIPVPPIAEQEKIVAELDCLTGIIEKKKKQLEELDKLAQSIFYDMFGDPITNEKGWEVKKLGEICSAITKGTTPTTLGFNFSNTGINFIKIESIAEDGSFVREKFAYIPEECDKLMARSQLQNGDILFSIAGALGRCAIVNETILPGNTNQALAIIRLFDKGEETLKYVEYYLRSQYVRRVIETLKTGVAQLNLSLGQLKQLLIVLPPVLYLRDFFVKANAIEKQKGLVKRSIVETETLFNSRMDFWFNN